MILIACGFLLTALRQVVLCHLFHLLASVEEHHSDYNNNADEEVPDEFSCDTLGFFIAEFTFKSIAAVALPILALTAIFAYATAPFTLCLKHG